MREPKTNDSTDVAFLQNAHEFGRDNDDGRHGVAASAGMWSVRMLITLTVTHCRAVSVSGSL